MSSVPAVTYSPLNILKPIAQNIWIVDGPAIRFGMPWPKMSFPTRMTIIRLHGDQLFMHSPTALEPELARQIATIGTPTWIIGPNRIHYWWIKDWKLAYPQAQIYLAPHIRKQGGDRINFDAQDLVENSGYIWDDCISTVSITGSYMSEFEFFHKQSRTLILTDLIENFEPEKLGIGMRWLAQMGGVLDPDGKTPYDMRLTFLRNREKIRAAIQTMIAWQPERIVLAHGRWYDSNAVAELKRAFRWLNV